MGCIESYESAIARAPEPRSVPLANSELKKSAGDQPSSYESICATEPRFCLPKSVKLHLHGFFSGSRKADDYKIEDVNTNIAYFKCDGQGFGRSFMQKKTIMDLEHHPILTLNQPTASVKHTYFLYAGAETSDRLVGSIQNQSTFGLAADMFVEFKDVTNGKNRVIYLKGDQRNKVCSISLGELKPNGIPIGRIYCPKGSQKKQEYFVEVAAGIDIALLVMLCIAFDEHKHEDKI